MLFSCSVVINHVILEVFLCFGFVSLINAYIRPITQCQIIECMKSSF